MPQIKNILNRLQLALQSSSDSAKLDAELLLCKACVLTRTQLYAYPEQEVNAQQQSIVDDLLKRRLQGEPMAYILGKQEFYGLSLLVSSDVLIPRPATECLVDWILESYQNKPLKVLDLGTGSGAIAIALAQARPQWQLTATDNSQSAIELARKNAHMHQLSSLKFRCGDWYAAISEGEYDVIVSNPPYIAPADPHLAALTFEPQSALVAANKGMADLNYLLRSSQPYLTPGGVLVLEHGYDQGSKVREMALQVGWQQVQTYADLSGQPRFTVLYR